MKLPKLTRRQVGVGAAVAASVILLVVPAPERGSALDALVRGLQAVSEWASYLPQ